MTEQDKATGARVAHAAGDVRATASLVTGVAGGVGEQAAAIGDAAPLLAGTTDRIEMVADGIGAAGVAADRIGEGVEHVAESIPTMTPAIRRARQAALAPQLAEVLAARAALFDEGERLEAATRAAMDVKASIRRDPVRIAGLAAGTGFVLAGGPQRAWRMIRNRIRPRQTGPVLPPTLDRVFAGLGDDGPEAARELVDLIGAAGRPAGRRGSRIGGLISGSVFLPLGLRFGRQLAAKLTEIEPDDFGEHLREVRARNAKTSPPGPPAGRPPDVPLDPGKPGAPAT
ncbi:MAG: hypothetical protein WCH74_09085 [Chloroflexota bacterium]